MSCDLSNGYTYNFEVYRGKEGCTLSSNGLSYDVIIDIVSGFDNQGHIVYMDNFYTLPILFKELANLGFGAVRTLDTFWKGVPNVLKIQKINISKTSCNHGHGIWIGDGVLRLQSLEKHQGCMYPFHS